MQAGAADSGARRSAEATRCVRKADEPFNGRQRRNGPGCHNAVTGAVLPVGDPELCVAKTISGGQSLRLTTNRFNQRIFLQKEWMIHTMAKAATKKAATSDTTLTLKEIGVTIAEQFELPKSHAQQIMAETVSMMQKQLKKGGKVRISGLGILQVRKTAARKGVNPATGEAIKIKAGKRLKFSADRGFKA